MAVEVRQFSPTIPANTPASAGWTSPMVFPARTVEGIDVRVPPGPGGYVGWAIGAAGVPLIPLNPGQWIITDDEVLSWDLQGMLTSGVFTFFGYNTGRDPHTIYVRFRLGLLPPPSVAPPTLLPPNALTFGGH